MQSHYYKLLILLSLVVSCQVVLALETPQPEPNLIYKPVEFYALSPLYSPDETAILSTDSSETGLWIVTAKGDKPRRIASGKAIGKRFVFEPNQERVVFKQTINALPGKPERLFSTGIYLYDPISRTSNMEGRVFGPYIITHKVFYRNSLLEPLTDYEGKIRMAGPYLDLSSGEFWVLNEQGDTTYSSKKEEKFISMEISADGKHVAALMEQPAENLVIIDMENGKKLSIPQGTWPSWSADGNRLVYLKPNGEIWLHDLSTMSDKMIFQNNNFSPQTPSLNQNGTKVLFVSKGAICEIAIP